MKTLVWTLAAIVGLSAAAWAQERRDSLPSALWSPDEPGILSLREEPVHDDLPDFESSPLPRSLSGPLSEPAKDGVVYLPFSLGPAGGYMRAHGADKGTWFGGVQARLRFGVLAAEASITFHQNEYENGDVVVTQYPLQLTAFLYPLPEGPFRPYILGGVGWYYTRVDYRGLFSTLDDHTDHVFGEHLGAGAELFLGPRMSFDADVRYIFLNPHNDQVIHRDFNYWQITLGLNFFF